MPAQSSYIFGQKGRFIDCSGFTKKMIPELKHGSYNQYDQSSKVDVQGIIPGDLVFLKVKETGPNKTDHVGLITDVLRVDGNVVGYDVTHASSGRGKNTRNVQLGQKADIFNSKLVGFGTLDPKTDPLRPNASKLEKALHNGSRSQGNTYCRPTSHEE